MPDTCYILKIKQTTRAHQGILFHAPRIYQYRSSLCLINSSSTNFPSTLQSKHVKTKHDTHSRPHRPNSLTQEVIQPSAELLLTLCRSLLLR
jgi:hypothetical protein